MAAARWLAALAAVAGATGCATAGHRDLAGDDGSAPAADAAPVGPAGQAPAAIGIPLFSAPCEAGAPSVAWSPLRRISRVEYDNMVHDLLGDTTRPAEGFPPESPLTVGVNLQANTYAGVSTLIVQAYAQAAETLAETAVSNAASLASMLPCTSRDEACARTFIADWANRAFRGQLDPATETSLVSLYSETAAQFDFTTGIQAVITAVLESPRFLYVLELGEPGEGGAVVPLAPVEVAARLALFLWRSVPDATLMQAASAGQLATADQVRAQATRMLADARANDAVADFTTQWMQLQATPTLGKDTQFGYWTNHANLGAELVDETVTNVTQAVADGGTLTDLLTSPSSYVNSDLAAFYGQGPGNSPVALGQGPAVTVHDTAVGDTQFVRTTLPHRAGILTNGSVLATQAHSTLPSSVLRGKLVREQVLCDAIPLPPPNIPAPAASVGDAGTTRAVLEAHFDKQPCVGCHKYMDPIGLGFGFFDATGAYQPNDANGFGGQTPPPGGFPAIDAGGQIYPLGAGELSATFDGATDLATQLAGAQQTHQCFTLQELRYALSRVESPADACSVQGADKAFVAGGLGLKGLLVAITGSDAFRYRSATTTGACSP